MTNLLTEKKAGHFTKAEWPLTAADAEALKSQLQASYKINLVLVPLLALIFFWGMLYFIIFFVFTLLCNALILIQAMKEEEALARPKIVFTGIITATVKAPVEDGYDSIVYMGRKRLISLTQNHPLN